MPVITPERAGGINVCAFLDMTAVTEIGHPMLKDPRTDNGYRVIVGSLPSKLILMENYFEHPNKLVNIRKGLSSTAAGRYQQLYRFWPHYKAALSLPDFSPLSQDRCALQQIKEQRALPLIKVGRIAEAIEHCSNIWASFAGAGYGQHEFTLARMLKEYNNARGLLCDEDKTWYERVLTRSKSNGLA